MELSDFKDRHAGEEVIVIGNGPGLKNIPFAFLESRPNFVMNYFSAWVPFLKPDYWLALDPLCFSGAEYVSDTVKLIKAHHAPQFEEYADDQLVLYQMRDRIPGYQWTEEWGLKYSSTAHAALHLAHYMGAAKALLVGVDCTYGMGMYENLGPDFKGLSRIPHFYDPRKHFNGRAEQWDEDFGLLAEWADEQPHRMEVVNLSIPTECRSLPRADYREYWSPAGAVERSKAERAA
jgi:hypothetical protein